MTARKHVVCVGFHATEAHAVDFATQATTAVMSKGSAARLHPDLAANFDRIGVLDLPASLDLDEYDRAVDQMRDVADELAEEFGPPAAVIGLYEHTTLPAARLREHFGIRGTSVWTALLCRDKVLMKEAVSAAGVRVPRFLALGPDTSREDLRRFVHSVPGRIVVKPRSQGASIGVRILDRADELLGLDPAGASRQGYEVEEFVDGEIFHLDGIVRDGVIRWLCPSRYVTTPYAFQHEDTPMMSVTLDDRGLVTRIAEFTASVLRGLALTDSAFHLELFRTPGDELVFLEIGNRFGGAGVPAHHRTCYGVDLAREAVLACTGEPSELAGPAVMLDRPGVGASGWLFVPLGETRRCWVTEVHGLDELPDSVVLASTPAVGDVLNEAPAVWNTAGRFVLSGETAASVERDLARVAETYSIGVSRGD